MSAWQWCERDTQELRRESGCPPDACIYRLDDLRALVFYADVDGRGMRWHLYVASAHRLPDKTELLEARQSLLSGIEDWDWKRDQDCGDYCLHLWELLGRLQ